jgi:hypothetical protein
MIFCLDVYDYKYTLKFLIKFCLHIKNYKHGDGAKLGVYLSHLKLGIPLTQAVSPRDNNAGRKHLSSPAVSKINIKS